MVFDMTDAKPQIAIIMGSKSDWDTMQEAARELQKLHVPYASRVVSAHRTPDYVKEYVEQAEAEGIEVFIAGAGGAAHLPGMAKSYTTRPVIGVPVPVGPLQGIDALLSMLQMPKGVGVLVVGIGKAGAANAALEAVSILALNNAEFGERLRAYRKEMRDGVLREEVPRLDE